MTQTGKTPAAKAGQRAALTMAAVGVLWLLINEIGREYAWPFGVIMFFDLAALLGFGFALWKTYQLWQLRQKDEG